MENIFWNVLFGKALISKKFFLLFFHRNWRPILKRWPSVKRLLVTQFKSWNAGWLTGSQRYADFFSFFWCFFKKEKFKKAIFSGFFSHRNEFNFLQNLFFLCWEKIKIIFNFSSLTTNSAKNVTTQSTSSRSWPVLRLDFRSSPGVGLLYSRSSANWAISRTGSVTWGGALLPRRRPGPGCVKFC